MTLLFKRLKVELYYLQRMLREDFGSHLFAYCKNRYFGRFLAARFPRYEGRVDERFEMHVLCQKAMLWPLIVCLRSFLYHSGLCPQIIIHVDDFDDYSVALLEDKFSNVRVLRWDDATAAINQRADISDAIKRIRFGKNILATKLTDFYLLSSAKLIMVLGSDVLFYSMPNEIVEYIRGRTSLDAIGSYDGNDMPIPVDARYKKALQIKEQGLNHLNSDLIVFDKTRIPHEWFTEYFEHLADPESYFVDSAGFSCLYARLRWRFLDRERYRIKGGIEDSTVMKHFTSPRRWQLYSWGIDLARRKMSL